MANSDSSDSDSDNRNEQAIIIMTAAIAATTHFNSLCQAAASAGAVVASNFFDSSDEEDPVSDFSDYGTQHGDGPDLSPPFGVSDTQQAGPSASRPHKKKKKAALQERMANNLETIGSSIQEGVTEMRDLKLAIRNFVQKQSDVFDARDKYETRVMQCLMDLPINEEFKWNALKHFIGNKDSAKFFVRLPDNLRLEFLVNMLGNHG